MFYKHGNTTKSGPNSPTYGSWYRMIRRCTDEKYERFQKYGAKGVKVCDRWLEFANFLEDMGERPDGHTLDRIDAKKGYSPDNCRWATPLEQALNRSSTVMVTYAGEELCLKHAAEAAGVPYSTVQNRMYRGWPQERWLEKRV